MISVREKVFETNSSACHALTVIPQKDLEDFAKNRCHKCIYFPDTGEYQTSNYYQIMEIEDAFKQYNRDHEKPNAHYREKGWLDLIVKTYPDTDQGLLDFEEDLDKDFLQNDQGKYLSFENLMKYTVIEHEMKFDIGWWNNN